MRFLLPAEVINEEQSKCCPAPCVPLGLRGFRHNECDSTSPSAKLGAA